MYSNGVEQYSINLTGKQPHQVRNTTTVVDSEKPLSERINEKQTTLKRKMKKNNILHIQYITMYYS